MSKGKKSFILYLDQQELFNKLPDEIAGKLIKHIFSYVNCENPEASDLLLDIAFSPIKQSLKRDLNKWETQLEQRSKAGKISAERRATKANEAQRKATTVESRSTKSTDSVSVSVNVSESVSDSEVTKDRFAEFWSLYGKKVDSAKCKAKFSKLSKSDVELIFDNLPDYVLSKPDKQFRKNPITWLNGKCWNDEVINDERFNGNNARSNQKESSHERIKRENQLKYGQPDECGLAMGEDDRHLGREVGEGQRTEAISGLDNQPFIDYDQSS